MRQVPGQLLKSGDYTHLAPGEVPFLDAEDVMGLIEEFGV